MDSVKFFALIALWVLICMTAGSLTGRFISKYLFSPNEKTISVIYSSGYLDGVRSYQELVKRDTAFEYFLELKTIDSLAAISKFK